MKILSVLLILFVNNFIFSQIRKDTLTIDQRDIMVKVDTFYNTRTKPIINTVNLNKDSRVPLNGLYKINVDKNNYFITNYKKGYEDNEIFNVYKKYQNGRLKQLDIKGKQIMGATFISILEYNCGSNVFLVGFTKKYFNNEIVDKIRIHQKVKTKTIQWKIYYPNKTMKKLRFNKTSLNICK